MLDFNAMQRYVSINFRRINAFYKILILKQFEGAMD